MKKLLSYVPNWLLLPLISILFFVFWPIIFIIMGTSWLFSKKTDSEQKIMGAKIVIIIIFFLIAGIIYANYEISINNFLELAFKLTLIIVIIGIILFAIKDKFFPNIKWLNKKKENSSEKKDVVYGAGDIDKFTLGHKKDGEFDIYWEDIIASKNNKEHIITSGNEEIFLSGFYPEDSLEDFVNKTCPFCNGNVDRFYYIENFSENKDDFGEGTWMEVCWKCKKILYLEDVSQQD